MMNHIVQTYQRTKHKTPWNYLSAILAFQCNIQKGLHSQHLTAKDIQAGRLWSSILTEYGLHIITYQYAP